MRHIGQIKKAGSHDPAFFFRSSQKHEETAIVFRQSRPDKIMVEPEEDWNAT